LSGRVDTDDSPVIEAFPNRMRVARRKIAIALAAQMVACWFIAGMATPVDPTLVAFAWMGCILASFSASALTLWVWVTKKTYSKS